MNRAQLNKVTMYQVVIGTKNLYATQVAGIPALVNSFNEFQLLVDQIKIEHQIQKGQRGGITINKAELRQKLAETANVISSAIFAYAVDQKDSILQEAVTFTTTGLLRERESQMITDCCNIRDESKKVSAALKNYGISTKDLKAFQTLIDSFASVSDDPRQSNARGASTTENLLVLFELCDEKLYDNIDRLMLQFENPDPTFFRHFSHARIIVDRGFRYNKSDENEEQEEELKTEAEITELVRLASNQDDPNIGGPVLGSDKEAS